MTGGGPALIDYSVAERALDLISGDHHIAQPFEDGALLAVADGLGHGPEAAHAARTAIGILTAEPNLPVDLLIRRCHAGLKGTRGAAIALMSLGGRTGQMQWLSIGNVEGMLLRSNAAGQFEHHSIVMRGGIVGQNLPLLRPVSIALRPGDTLILATDGISPGFDRGTDPNAPSAHIAASILQRFGKAHDDALVLVARWNGTPDAGSNGTQDE